MNHPLLLLVTVFTSLLIEIVPLKGACLELKPGEIVSGSITAARQTNCYTFSAASNDVLYLTILRTNGPGNYPYFYLYDPAGTIMDSG